MQIHPRQIHVPRVVQRDRVRQRARAVHIGLVHILRDRQARRLSNGGTRIIRLLGCLIRDDLGYIDDRAASIHLTLRHRVAGLVNPDFTHIQHTVTIRIARVQHRGCKIIRQHHMR